MKYTGGLNIAKYKVRKQGGFICFCYHSVFYACFYDEFIICIGET